MEAWQMRAGHHSTNFTLPQNLPLTGLEMRLLLSFFINCSRAPSHHYAGVNQQFVSSDLKLKTIFLERVTFLKTHKILHSLLTFTILRIEPINP